MDPPDDTHIDCESEVFINKPAEGTTATQSGTALHSNTIEQNSPRPPINRIYSCLQCCLLSGSRVESPAVIVRQHYSSTFFLFTFSRRYDRSRPDTMISIVEMFQEIGKFSWPLERHAQCGVANTGYIYYTCARMSNFVKEG